MIKINENRNLKALIILISIFLTNISNLNSQWQSAGPYNGQSHAIEVKGYNIVSGTWTGVLYSTNGGNNWVQSNLSGMEKKTTSFVVSENFIFAGITGGIYVSSDDGINWQQSLNIENISSLAAGSGNIYGGCETSPGSGGVLATTNNGTNWSHIGLNGKHILSLITSGNYLVVGTLNEGIFITTNNGSNWINTSTVFGKSQCLASNNNFIYAGTNSYGIIISSNYGLNWVQSSLNSENVLSLEVIGDNIFAGTLNSGFFVSTNAGLSFTQYTFPFDIRSLGIFNSNIFAGTTFDGIYKSTNNGANWSKTNFNNQKIVGLSTDGIKIFAGSYNNGVQFSTNGATLWVQSDMVNQNVNSVAIYGNEVFAGTEAICSGIGMMRSTNGGLNWHEAGFYYDVLVSSVVMSGSNLLVGAWTCVDQGGVYLSTDKGNTFTNTLSGQDVFSIYANGNNVYAGMANNLSSTFGGINVSTNSGYNWQYIGPLNKTIYSVTTSGNRIYAGTGTGVQVTTNNGINWTQTSLNTGRIRSLLSTGNYLFAGTEANGVYFSSNNGTTWAQKNQGWINNMDVRKLILLNNKIYAGTFGSSVYVRDLAEIVSVKNISSEIPSGYSLSQNYPNPFNPVTNIKFSVPKDGHASLKIYDIAGKLVATYLDEYVKAGHYNAEVDGSELSSGTYFYTLKTDNFMETKKMILLK